MISSRSPASQLSTAIVHSEISATVSRVVNGKPGVSPATADRVLAAIEQLDYEDARARLNELLNAEARLAAVKIEDFLDAVRRDREPAVTGQEELVGQVGMVRKALDPTGLVFVHGELWQAHTDGGPLEVGTPVQVQGIEDGLVLEVSRAEPAPAPATA